MSGIVDAFGARQLQRRAASVDADDVRARQLQRDAAIRIAGAAVEVHDLRVLALGHHLQRELAEERQVARHHEGLEDRRLGGAEARAPAR